MVWFSVPTGVDPCGFKTTLNIIGVAIPGDACAGGT